jgi:hypothetical protein
MQKATVLLWFMALAGVLFSAPQKTAASYSKDYAVMIGGAPAGSEKVTEVVTRDGSIVSTSVHEIFVIEGNDTKRMSFQTELTLDKGSLAPLKYTCIYTSGDSHDSYDVAVSGNEISRMLVRGGKTSDAKATLTPGWVLVDINVYHHFDYLVRKYDQKKRGRQTFQNFLPVIAVEIPLSLTRLPDSMLRQNEKPEEAQVYRVEFGALWTGELAVGKDGRLVRLSIRDKSIEVVRQDLMPKLEQTTPAP